MIPSPGRRFHLTNIADNDFCSPDLPQFELVYNGEPDSWSRLEYESESIELKATAHLGERSATFWVRGKRQSNARKAEYFPSKIRKARAHIFGELYVKSNQKSRRSQFCGKNHSLFGCTTLGKIAGSPRILITSVNPERFILCQS